MKIYLIGMPGSGKTTLGKQVASDLPTSFVDLDYEIESREKKSIPEIFSQQGEDYFRMVESELLREWAASDKSFVMATGGGTPCFFQGIDVMTQTGISIFLDTPIDLLLKRLEKKSGRPLLQSKDNDELRNKLETLRQSRLPFYQRAQITLQSPTFTSLMDKIRFRK
jgi:shikimate kinase